MQAAVVCPQPDHVAHFSDLLAPAQQHYQLLSHQPTACQSASQHGLFTQPAVVRTLAAAQGPPYPYYPQAHQYQQPQQHTPYHTPPPAPQSHQLQAFPHNAAVAPLAPYGYNYSNQYQHHHQQQQQQHQHQHHQQHQQQQHSSYPVHSQNQVTTATHHRTARRQQQHMSERQLRSRNRGGRRTYADEEDDDDYEIEDDEDDPDSSDSAHESSSSRRQDGSPGSNAAAAAAASGGRGNTTIKTAQRWTQEEHDLLLQIVTELGNNRRWSEIAKHIPGRTGKQCRERWVNHMNPNSKKGSWDVAEELMLCKWHSILGSHWAKITRKLEGRTENAVKNHWNAAMRAKLPMRRHTPLNMYVSHIRTHVEASDALVKVLEALQEQHPDLVAETARAAADIVQRRLNPSSAAAVAASAAGGQQQGMLPLAASGEGLRAFGMTAAPSTPAAAAGGLPLQHQHLTEAQHGLQQLPTYLSTEAVLLAAGSQTLGESIHQQQPPQQHLMGGQQQQHSQQLQQQPWAVPPSATTPTAAAAAGIIEQPSVAKKRTAAAAAAAGGGGDAAVECEGRLAKRARLSSGASGVSCGTSPPEADDPGPAVADTAAGAGQSQQHQQQQQQQETAAAAMLHSPNMTSSNSNTSCMPGAAAGSTLQPQQQQQSQYQQQQQTPSTQPAIPLQQQQQQQQPMGSYHAAATAAAHTAAAAKAATRVAAIKRRSHQLIVDSLAEVAAKSEQMIFDLDIGKFLEAQQQQRQQQRRNKQLLRQQSAPVMQHYHHQQQQQQAGQLSFHHSDPSMPTAASAPTVGTPTAAAHSSYVIPPPAPLQLPQQQQQQQHHHNYHLDQLQQQTADELLAMQQQQQHHHHQQQQQQQRVSGPGVVPRRLTYDDNWLANFAPLMESWSTAAPGATVLDTLAAGGHTTGPNALPPPATAQLAEQQQQQQQQHEHRYREITTALLHPQQLQQTPLQRSHSEVVHSVNAAPLPAPLCHQLPDWLPLQTDLPTPQQQQYPYHHQQQQQQLALAPNTGTMHVGEAVSGRYSDHGNLMRSLSAPAHRLGAGGIGQLPPAGPAAADHNPNQPTATTSMLAAALARTSDFGQGPRASAAGGSAGVHLGGATSAGLPATSHGVSALLGSADLDDLGDHDLDDVFNGSQG